MRISSAVVAAAIVAGWTGCTGSSHLTDTHGRAYRAFLAEQRAESKLPYQEAVKGLDSEEAAIVALGYRESLSRKGSEEAASQEQVLLVAPPSRGGQRAQKLAPSVPQEK